MQIVGETKEAPAALSERLADLRIRPGAVGG
jgi:hypothetical protein